ncbi:unnamed protein product [Cuscuta epithymum]|uniref:Premnaspirodiene oxygenase-like n=1 Tax=Cuscuta epithymum TaxID=186058 RepID=A0AAV0GAJ9_9ASTE|nr:unnamed protein product [Cuscuta epithymum]
MDIVSNLLSLFLFISFIGLVVAMSTEWKRKRSLSSRGAKLPPGPWRLPLIGSLHHLIGAFPLRRLRELAERHGPLMHVQLGEVSAIIASSPDMAKAILKTHDIAFASRAKLLLPEIVCYRRSDIVFCSYGDYWRQMRKICIVELLSSKNVQSFGSIRSDQVCRLLEAVASHNGRPVNLTELVFQFTSSMTCRSAFGSIFKEADDFITLIKEVLALLGGFDIADIFPSLKLLHGLSPMRRNILRIHRKVDGILNAVIESHKKSLAAGNNGNGESGGEDLIDVLLRMKRTDGLQFPITDDNIKAVVFDLFTAGTETSSTTIIWAMTEMLRSPTTLAKAQEEVRKAFINNPSFDVKDVEELKYVKLVVKETLRLHPPTPLSIPRECMAETEINGYTIPVKTWVMVNVSSISTDPAYWENAESFVPERFENSGVDFLGNNFEFLPFGSGRRICPGLSFGLANVYLPLAKLLFHFDWKLPRETEYSRSLDLMATPGITAGKKDDLYLVATPYVQNS